MDHNIKCMRFSNSYENAIRANFLIRNQNYTSINCVFWRHFRKACCIPLEYFSAIFIDSILAQVPSIWFPFPVSSNPVFFSVFQSQLYYQRQLTAISQNTKPLFTPLVTSYPQQDSSLQSKPFFFLQAPTATDIDMIRD